MASGSFSNGSGQNCKLVINWSSSPGNGGSTVSASLVAQNQNNAYFSAVVYGYGLTINGSGVSGSGAGLSSGMNGASTLISHSVWVGYYGNKSININGYANFNGIWSLSNQSISGDVSLDKVGSPPTLSSFSLTTSTTNGIISEVLNTLEFSWSKASSYDNTCKYYFGVSIDSADWAWTVASTDINTQSCTYTIPRHTQGTTYKFALYAKNEVGTSSYLYTDTITINKLNPPTIQNTIGTVNPYISEVFYVYLSATSQTMGGSTSPAGALYYNDTLLAEGSPYVVSGDNVNLSFTYAADKYLACLGATRYQSDEFKVVIWTTNSNGSKSESVSQSFTININTDGGATPLLSSPTLSGGEFGYGSTCFVQGRSTVNVTSPSVTFRRALSSVTASYSIYVTDSSKVDGQSASYSNLLAGKKTATVVAVDSRGLQTSASVDFIVQAYSKPTIKELKASRLDDPQTSVALTYQLYYTPIYRYPDVNTQGTQLNDINTMQYATYLKDYDISGGFTWSNLSSRTATTATNLSTENVYWARLKITDKLYPSTNDSNTYTEATVLIPTINTNLGIRSWGVGINCVPQKKWGLEVSGSSYFKNSVSIDNGLISNGKLTVNSTINTTGGIERETDTRYENTSPSDYANVVRFRGLKTTPAINAPSGASENGFVDLIGFCGWGDQQASGSHEIAIGKAGIAHRWGESDTTWSNWLTLMDSDDYDHIRNGETPVMVILE